MRKVQEILKKFGNYNSSEIEIKTDKLNFNILFLKTQLLHLLGVHYIHSDFRGIRGRQLLREISYKNYKDEEIYNLVKKSNPDQLENVKERVQYFEEFMYNLDKAEIVEMTNPHTKIKSHHLILQAVDNKYLQLGIARGSIADYFETFLISSNEFFFSNTDINEEITGIYIYDDECNLIPFSFDPIKAATLEKEYREQKQREQEKLVESKELYTAFGNDREEDECESLEQETQEWDLEM